MARNSHRRDNTVESTAVEAPDLESSAADAPKHGFFVRLYTGTGAFEVIVRVMAAGVNFNNVWAALGQPISIFRSGDHPEYGHHIGGSDASGIVWKVGAKVKRWKVGDEVIVHCNQDDGDDEECNGGDPMFSPTQRIWGYETPDGSFGQFCRVQSRQLMRRPKHLTWEEGACYTLTLATAYRMLFGHAPHTVRPGQNVLIWGASGGLGVFGVQLCAASGANAIAQRTTKEVVANEVYELTAEFGQRTDNSAVTPTLELWVGGAVTRGDVVGGTLVGTQSVTPVAGQFAPATVRWTAPSAGPLIGQRLSVRLANSSGAQANYDNVSLTATPGVAPVPTMTEWAMILFAAMLGGGASLYLQYRRRLA